MKKTLLLIGLLALLAALVAGFYFLFLAPSTKAPATGGSPSASAGTAGTLPSAGNQYNPASGAAAAAATPSLAKSLGLIATDPVLNYAVTAGNVVNAIEPDGKIIQVTNGQMTVVSTLALSGIIRADFSYDGMKVLVNFGGPTNPQTSVFDVATKAWTPMPAGWISPAWAPNDYRIAYYIVNKNNTETFYTLNAGQAKTAKPAAVLTLHAQDFAVMWTGKNQLALTTKPSAFAAGSVWLLDTQKQTLTPFVADTAGLAVTWNHALPSTSTVALGFSAGGIQIGGTLQLIDPSGAPTQQLKFLTLPSKCVFGASGSASATSTRALYLYCAVPRDQNTLSVSHLPDDYDQMALFTSDDIYRINAATGAVDAVTTDPSHNFDVSNVTFVNGTLFFINRYDHKLYAIVLSA